MGRRSLTHPLSLPFVYIFLAQRLISAAFLRLSPHHADSGAEYDAGYVGHVSRAAWEKRAGYVKKKPYYGGDCHGHRHPKVPYHHAGHHHSHHAYHGKYGARRPEGCRIEERRHYRRDKAPDEKHSQ